MRRLQVGAVILLDALGFKGIWKRVDPNVVLDRLRRIKHKGLGLRGKDGEGVLLHNEALNHRVRCVSDTIIVTVTLHESWHANYPERPAYLAMFSALHLASAMMEFALDGSPALLFRGCLAAGRLRVDGDFLIGPAIDEAAERYEQSDGPFLWATPSALRLNDSYADTYYDRIEPNLMIRYPVPMKVGGPVETVAYNYCGLSRSADSWGKLRENIIRAFGEGRLKRDVEKKRRNIISFLDYVQSAAARPRPCTITIRKPFFEDLTPGQMLYLARDFGAETVVKWPRRQTIK